MAIGNPARQGAEVVVADGLNLSGQHPTATPITRRRTHVIPDDGVVGSPCLDATHTAVPPDPASGRCSRGRCIVHTRGDPCELVLSVLCIIHG